MGVPGFYSWLTKRYPLIKHLVGKRQIPSIDYLYLDMNGIIYKCVKDDSIIFKSHILPKELEQIWIQIFNYINLIVNMLKPSKMILMALDGVAPRSKMNNQRARRFKSALDFQKQLENLHGYSDNVDSQSNFKNNSISPGTQFMQQLNQMLRFFIKKKIQQDDQWKKLSIVFTGSDVPGQGEHKIMEYIRSNNHKFDPEDNHCLYGADADLIMLGLTLPMKNICIIREQFIPTSNNGSLLATRKEKHIQFEMIFLTILREYFHIQYEQIIPQLTHIQFNISRIINDFVFLFFFIGNDFLPRCYTYNIRQSSIEKLIRGFKNFLVTAQDYVVGEKSLNIKQLAKLTTEIAKFQPELFEERAKDTQNYINKHQKQFEGELFQEMKVKVKKETQLLLVLRQIYANNDGGLQKQFYNSKFNIDPVNQPELFYSILSYYTYGLNFVHSYYFINLPSWSWYYPYYYAPLLSDLSYYINYLAFNNCTLDPFQLGKPFQPFKQLLCILPKQSAELLPQSFQSYLVDRESALRSPLDYYPDDFKTDLYGSVHQYQEICLIPFLDHNMIDRIYEQAIKNVKPQQLPRNHFQHTQLYEYNPLYNEIIVDSPFEHIQKFRCNIKITSVNLQTVFKWSTETKAHKQIKYLRMPTLNMKKYEWYSSIGEKKKNTIYYIKLIEQPKDIWKLGNVAFYGYPLQHSGIIQAILTPKQFKCLGDISLRNYGPNIKYDHWELFDTEVVKNRTADAFDSYLQIAKNNYPHINMTNTQKLYFIADTQYFIRRFNGSFMIGTGIQQYQKYLNFEVVPTNIISSNRLYETTKDQVTFQSIEQEFPPHEEVLILNVDQSCKHRERIIGGMGKVYGYNKDQNKLKIKIIMESKFVNQQQLQTIANTNQIFFDLRLAAQILQVKFQILLKIIDSIRVQGLPKNKGLPNSIDIGLNFISRAQNKLVPNLTRINFGNINKNIQKFKQIQLSLRAVELIIEYKQKFKEIFDFITKRHFRLIDEAKKEDKRINWSQSIQLKDIFKNQQNAANSIMKLYIWLIKKQQTHMPLSSIYSKQISFKKIQKLQSLFKQKQKAKNKSKKYKQPLQIQIDPNYVFSNRLSRYGYIYLSRKPALHAIADQVICLKHKFFGHNGVIVGIDDNKFQVLFEKPCFGKTNLGGLCENLRGGKFNFAQLFNPSKWPNLIINRSNQKKGKDSDWLAYQDNFQPKFRSNPLKNFNDIHILSKVLPQDFYQYVTEVQKKLKQIQLEQGYIVLDNKNNDYAFKYDNKKPSLPQDQIQNLKKQPKYIQKQLKQIIKEQIKQQTKKQEEQHSRQVIQSKEQTNNKQAIADQEDGQDIFG